MDNTVNLPFSIYKFFICLYCIALACRELFVPLGKPVYIYLFLLYAIPLFLLGFELIKYKVNIFNLLGVSVLISCYLMFSRNNINGIKLFLPLVLAGIAFRGLEFGYIAKCFLLFQCASLLIRIFLLANGIIQENETYAGWKSNGEFAHDLGYGNPNEAGTIFFYLNCMIYVVLYKKSRLISFISILLVTLLSYKLTICRTAALSSLLLLLSYLLPTKLINNLIKNRCVFIGIPLMIILLPMCFLSFQLVGINDLLSGRLSFIAYVYNQFGSIKDLMSGVYIDDLEGIPIDNVFAYLLVYGGALSWVIFAKFYMRLLKNRMQVDLYILIVILCIVVSGIGESAWAVYGRFGSSLFWILLINQTIYYMYPKMTSYHKYKKCDLYL